MKHLILSFFICQLTISFSQGNPNNSSNEIIVRINYKYLRNEVIEDVNQQLFPFHHVLNAPGIAMLSSMGVPGLQNFPMQKIFPLMSWKDTISKNIYGDKIPVPPFWATFVIKVPTEKQFCPTLKKLQRKPELIHFAHPNYPVEKTSVPDDSLYYRQYSLNGTPTYPNAGINLEEAWDIETGEKFVKVAVLDSGIDTTNADLKVLFGGFYTNAGTFNSQFEPGYGNDFEGHGTSVASIIGAKRNNHIGISGIAGGNDSTELGVSLIDLRYSFSSGSGSKYICAAVVDAARTVGSLWAYPDGYYNGDNYFNGTPGFGVQLQNNSYVIKADIPRCDNKPADPIGIPDNSVVNEPSCQLCREAYLFSYKSGVINIVARGNSGSIPDTEGPTYVEKLYPQNFQDSWIISVGASGYDGTTVREGINQGTGDQTFNFYSLYGGNMDLIAPGSTAIVYAQRSNNFSPIYDEFNGTSAAAPHATGVVALLLSHYNKPCYSNKNLAIEDVEYILQQSATDVLDPGFDEVSGAGRLNAGAAIKMIENPTKQIVHPQTLISSVEVSRDTIALGYGQAFVANGWGPISSGFPLIKDKVYQVAKVLYENTYSFAEYGTASAIIDTFWTRPSASNSIKSYDDYDSIYAGPGQGWVKTFDLFDMTPEVMINSVDLLNKTIKTRGYYYHFIRKYIDNTFDLEPFSTINTWLPINPELDTARMPVSIYIIDTLQSSWYDFPCDAENLPWDSTWTPFNSIYELKNEGLKLYPNPTKDYVQIDFENLSGNKAIELVDLKGKVVLSFETEQTNYYLNTSSLLKGVYILTCINNNNSYHYKLLKE